MNNQGEVLYDIWNRKTVVADCLHKLGLTKEASHVHTDPFNSYIIDAYVNLAKKTAEQKGDNEVIDILCFAGLIYG